MSFWKRWSKSKDAVSISAEAEQSFYAVNARIVKLHQHGKLSEAEALARENLRVTREHFGLTNRLTAIALINLGGLLKAVGHFGEAEELLVAAAEIQQAALGELAPERLLSLDALSDLYRRSGRPALALPLLQIAIKIERAVLAPNDPALATCLNDVALLLFQLGDLDACERLCREALDIRRVQCGESDPLYAQSLNNLARVRLARNDLEGAEPLIRAAFDIRRSVLGDTHPEAADSIDALVDLHRRKGDFATAARWQAENLVSVRAIHGNRSIKCASALNNLADLHFKAEQFIAAQPFYEEALATLLELAGEKDRNTAAVMNNLANLYRNIGKYDAAAPLFENALRIRREVLGELHDDILLSLDDTADFFRRSGRGSVAALYREAVSRTRDASARDEPDRRERMAVLRSRLADVDDPGMLQLWQEEADECRRMLPASKLDLATALVRLAFLDGEDGRPGRAVESFKEAVEIRASALGEDHPDYAVALSYLGRAYLDCGNESLSRHALEKGLAILRAVPCEQHDLALALHNLAGFHHHAGEFSRAASLFEEALQIVRAGKVRDSQSERQILRALGDLYLEIGNPVLAERHAAEAVTQVRKSLGAEHGALGTFLITLGRAQFALGKRAEAEESFRNAAELMASTLGIAHPKTQVARVEIANLYTSMGALDTAEAFTEGALRVMRSHFGNNHLNSAVLLSNLGLIREQRGNLESAEALYGEALRIERSQLGPSHRRIAAPLRNLARLCAATGRFRQALEYFEELLDIGQREQAEAFLLLSERDRLVRAFRAQITLGQYLSVVLKLLGDAPELAVRAFNRVLRVKGVVSELAAAERILALREYSEAQGLFSEIRELERQIAKSTMWGPENEQNDASYQSALKALGARQVDLENRLALSMRGQDADHILAPTDISEIADRLPPNSMLIEYVRFGHVTFADEKQEDRFAVFAVTAGAAHSCQFVDLGPAAEIATLIQSLRLEIAGEGPLPSTPDDGGTPTDGFDCHSRSAGPPQENRHLRLPATPDRTNSAGSTGLELRKRIVDSLKGVARGRRLFIAPDGEICQIPFEVLPTTEGRRMIDDHVISYLSVARDLKRFGSPLHGRSAPPLVLADPDYDLNEVPDHLTSFISDFNSGLREVGLQFERLPATHEEGEIVGGLLGVKPVLGGDAREGVFSDLHSPSVLHVATHGFFLSDERPPPPDNVFDTIHMLSIPGEGTRILGLQRRPVVPLLRTSSGALARLATIPNPLLRSGLALAGANRWISGAAMPMDAGDGLLTAADVASLDLTNTELVVLSACDTGLGQLSAGEGPFGLRRAVVLAGARSLVMSLWKVPDAATRDLMVDFYGRIVGGEPRAEALRAAQLAIRIRHPDPRFWAGFICQGEPGPFAIYGETQPASSSLGPAV